MSFSTQYPLNILLGDDDVVWGTISIGPIIGQVRSLDLKRTGDGQDVPDDYGGLRAYLLTKIRSELSMEILFNSSLTLPGLVAEIGFPLAGVAGRILDITPKWAEAGVRVCSVEASHWDSLDNGSNAMDAFYGQTETVDILTAEIGVGTSTVLVTTEDAGDIEVGDIIRVSGMTKAGGFTVDAPDPNGIWTVTFANSTDVAFDIHAVSPAGGAYDAAGEFAHEIWAPIT